MVSGFGPQPAGVATPPISGPQAQEISSARPKLLLSGSTFASFRIDTAIGINIAATAMSVIQPESSAPMARKHRMMAFGLCPSR